jgi:hypothetical protein
MQQDPNNPLIQPAAQLQEEERKKLERTEFKEKINNWSKDDTLKKARDDLERDDFYTLNPPSQNRKKITLGNFYKTDEALDIANPINIVKAKVELKAKTKDETNAIRSRFVEVMLENRCRMYPASIKDSKEYKSSRVFLEEILNKYIAKCGTKGTKDVLQFIKAYREFEIYQEANGTIDKSEDDDTDETSKDLLVPTCLLQKYQEGDQEAIYVNAKRLDKLLEKYQNLQQNNFIKNIKDNLVRSTADYFNAYSFKVQEDSDGNAGAIEGWIADAGAKGFLQSLGQNVSYDAIKSFTEPDDKILKTKGFKASEKELLESLIKSIGKSKFEAFVNQAKHLQAFKQASILTISCIIGLSVVKIVDSHLLIVVLLMIAAAYFLYKAIASDSSLYKAGFFLGFAISVIGCYFAFKEQLTTEMFVYLLLGGALVALSGYVGYTLYKNGISKQTFKDNKYLAPAIALAAISTSTLAVFATHPEFFTSPSFLILAACLVILYFIYDLASTFFFKSKTRSFTDEYKTLENQRKVKNELFVLVEEIFANNINKSLRLDDDDKIEEVTQVTLNKDDVFGLKTFDTQVHALQIFQIYSRLGVTCQEIGGEQYFIGGGAFRNAENFQNKKIDDIVKQICKACFNDEFMAEKLACQMYLKAKELPSGYLGMAKSLFNVESKYDANLDFGLKLHTLSTIYDIAHHLKQGNGYKVKASGIMEHFYNIDKGIVKRDKDVISKQITFDILCFAPFTKTFNISKKTLLVTAFVVRASGYLSLSTGALLMLGVANSENIFIACIAVFAFAILFLLIKNLIGMFSTNETQTMKTRAFDRVVSSVGELEMEKENRYRIKEANTSAKNIMQAVNDALEEEKEKLEEEEEEDKDEEEKKKDKKNKKKKEKDDDDDDKAHHHNRQSNGYSGNTGFGSQLNNQDDEEADTETQASEDDSGEDDEEADTETQASEDDSGEDDGNANNSSDDSDKRTKSEDEKHDEEREQRKKLEEVKQKELEQKKLLENQKEFEKTNQQIQLGAIMMANQEVASNFAALTLQSDGKVSDQYDVKVHAVSEFKAEQHNSSFNLNFFKEDDALGKDSKKMGLAELVSEFKKENGEIDPKALHHIAEAAKETGIKQVSDKNDEIIEELEDRLSEIVDGKEKEELKDAMDVMQSLNPLDEHYMLLLKAINEYIESHSNRRNDVSQSFTDRERTRQSNPESSRDL